METCTAEFARLSAPLHDLHCDANPLVTFRSPLALQNWTLPVIEFLLVAGAILFLVHAVVRYRRYQDASNLVVWIAGVVALLIIEPVAYFPQWFGLEDALGLTFVHNAFSVQFLYDRLPLYIVAMYPVFGCLAWTLVQRTGVFTKYHPVVGATCVAFTFQCSYEVVDTVGPQLRWWAWNTELPTSTPALGSIPYLNIQSFSLAIPFGIALAVLLTRRTSLRVGGWPIARAVVAASVAVWPVMFAASLPAMVVQLVGGSIAAARFVTLWGIIAISGVVTAAAFVGALRARRLDSSVVPVGVRGDYVPLGFGVAYLVLGVVFWASAAGEYLAAQNGVTPTGAPVGSMSYGIVTLVASVAILVGAYSATGRTVTHRGLAEASTPT